MKAADSYICSPLQDELLIYSEFNRFSLLYGRH
jgi:hypothetical protein